MNTQTIDLDVTKRPAVAPVVYLGQGDKNGTTLVCNIYDDGEALSLTSYTVKLAIMLPHHAGCYEVSGTASGNTATFTVDENYAASVAGVSDVAYVEVVGAGDEVICSTSRFRVVVLESAMNADPAGAWTNGVEEFLGYAAGVVDEMEIATQRAQDEITAAQSAMAGFVTTVGGYVVNETLVLGPNPSEE